MRAADLSPDRRTRLVPVPGRTHVEALVPPSRPSILNAMPVLPALITAEKALAETPPSRGCCRSFQARGALAVLDGKGD